MVVDQHDAALHDALRGRCSSTSVPSPGLETTVARPPARSIRPSIDSTRPRRSAGTAARSKPAPRSRTKTDDRVVGDLGVDVDLLHAGELGRVRHRLARREHERAGGGVDRAVARARELDAHAVELLDVARRRRRAPPRARRCRRRAAGRRTASRAARAPAGARATPRGAARVAWRWISARVCSTESCTRAAMSERSSERMRAVRSASRSTARRHTHGPAISSSAPATAPGASNVEDVPSPESSTTAPSAASASPP